MPGLKPSGSNWKVDFPHENKGISTKPREVKSNHFLTGSREVGLVTPKEIHVATLSKAQFRCVRTPDQQIFEREEVIYVFGWS